METKQSRVEQCHSSKWFSECADLCEMHDESEMYKMEKTFSVCHIRACGAEMSDRKRRGGMVRQRRRRESGRRGTDKLF